MRGGEASLSTTTPARFFVSNENSAMAAHRPINRRSRQRRIDRAQEERAKESDVENSASGAHPPPYGSATGHAHGEHPVSENDRKPAT